MKVRHGLLAVVFAALVAIPTAWAAGLWSTLPIIGGASFCASTVSGTGNLGGVTGQGQGTLGSICGQTVPAGPPSLTGAELVPMDTGQGGSGGSQAATAVARICQMGAGAATYNSPIGGVTTATIPDNTCYYMFNGTAAFSPFTLTMPPNPIDGQLLDISSDTTIASFTLSPNTTVTTTQAIKNAPTALTVSTTGAYNYRFIYRASDTTWRRVQ